MRRNEGERRNLHSEHDKKLSTKNILDPFQLVRFSGNGERRGEEEGDQEES